jgi:ribokinase
MSSGEILLLGDINIDTVWPVDEIPAPGRDAYIKKVSAGLGGAVLNSAIVLDRLGLPAAMLSCVGNDLWAARVFELLQQTGINLSYVQEIKQEGTGLIFLVVTPDGERTMYSYRGANVLFGPQHLDAEVFKQAGILHISGYSIMVSPQREAVWRALELAHQNKMLVSLDTGLEPALLNPDELRRLIEKVDICVTGLKETGQLYGIHETEKAADHLLSLGIKLAAVKLGKDGSYLRSEKERFFCPAFHVDVVDTTGAGDSYTAGLLYGWDSNLSLAASAVLASALGALAATVPGAGLGLPHKQAALDFLRSRRGEVSTELQVAVDEVISSFQSD